VRALLLSASSPCFFGLTDEGSNRSEPEYNQTIFRPTEHKLLEQHEIPKKKKIINAHSALLLT
jgi:hypothetical protein